MAVTQYVGARYVPHGWTDWNAETSYDALYVVKYNLAWYIAKKPVPVGTKPTCEKYWAMTDNWNGQVEEYRQTLEQFMAETDHNFDVTNGNLTQLTNRYNKMVDDFAHTRGIRNARLKFSAKCVFISDSFGSFKDDWITQIINILGLQESQYVRYGSGGGGWLSNGTQGTFKNILDKIKSERNDLNTFDYVVMVGGTNDTSTSMNSTFAGAVRESIDAAYAYFPNAKVLVGYVATLYRPTDFQGTPNRHSFISYGEMQCNAAVTQSGKAAFIPNLCNVVANLNNFTEGDLVHPNAEGFKYIAESVIQAMAGGGVYPFCNYTNFNKQVSDIENGWEITTRTFQYGHEVFCCIENIFYNQPTTPFNVTSVWKEIPISFELPYRGLFSSICSVSARVKLEGGTSYSEHAFAIKIDNRKIFIASYVEMNIIEWLCFARPQFKIVLY